MTKRVSACTTPRAGHVPHSIRETPRGSLKAHGHSFRIRSGQTAGKSATRSDLQCPSVFTEQTPFVIQSRSIGYRTVTTVAGKHTCSTAGTTPTVHLPFRQPPYSNRSRSLRPSSETSTNPVDCGRLPIPSVAHQVRTTTPHSTQISSDLLGRHPAASRAVSPNPNLPDRSRGA